MSGRNIKIIASILLVAAAVSTAIFLLQGGDGLNSPTATPIAAPSASPSAMPIAASSASPSAMPIAAPIAAPTFLTPEGLPLQCGGSNDYIVSNDESGCPKGSAHIDSTEGCSAAAAVMDGFDFTGQSAPSYYAVEPEGCHVDYSYDSNLWFVPIGLGEGSCGGSYPCICDCS